MSPVYNDANFRQQFPQFASVSAYPEAALQFAWNMGGSWINQQQQTGTSSSWGWCSGLSMTSTQLQLAADLMGAVLVYQLYGPAATTGSTAGTPSYSQEGEAPGAVQSASEGSISASFQLPEIGSSAFRSMLLASPPYGRMLLALLQTAASVGAYVPSRRPSWIPP